MSIQCLREILRHFTLETNSGDIKKKMENTLIVPKTSEKKSGGVVDVKFEKLAIYQLFSESQGIVHIFNAVMKTLLKCFGVEEDNGLTLFCRDFASNE